MRESTDSLLKRAALITKKISAARALYSELDQINEKLAKRRFTSKKIGRETFVLIDHFRSSKTKFRTVAFPRYELMISDLRGTK